MTGVSLVLYRLPELARADRSRRLWICSGEKDVHTLERLGELATTNPGGEGKGKWLPQFTATIKGWLGDVIVLQDNDKKGEDHGVNVAGALLGCVSAVKTLLLPNLPDKGDVTDWLDSGHTYAELLSQAEAAPPWKPPTVITAADSSPHPPQFNLTDLGNSKRLVHLHGHDLRFVDTWNKWLLWDGKRWRKDDKGQVFESAKATVRSIYGEASLVEDVDRRKALASWAKSSESESRIRAMVSLAKTDPVIAARPEDFDQDPWLFNLENGTADLRTGKHRAHSKADMITKLAPVSYREQAQCPLFLKFLDRVTDSSSELTGFLQRSIGYCLTGDTSERLLFVNQGGGSNGKTTLVSVVDALLGDYAMRIPTDTLMVKREGAIPNDIARLQGTRFAYASESEEGRRLGESLIKDLTGQDTISARFMRGEFFDFRPQFKLWLSTNHRPIIRGTDLAIWDRIRLVPWTVRIPEDEKDKHLVEKLKPELPGVLNWAIEGCMLWQKQGLGASPEVNDATQAYRQDMDSIGVFLDECCEQAEGAKIGKTEMYGAFCRWLSRSRDEEAPSSTSFTYRLREKGISENKTGRDGRFWEGLRLIAEK